MSMNLHVDGTREVVAVKSMQKSTQRISFSLYQTPTSVTRALLEAEDIAQAYRDWVLQDRCEETVEVYEPGDIFQEREPIGFKTVCHEDDHIKDFDKFIKECEDGGYDIEFYEL